MKKLFISLAFLSCATFNVIGQDFKLPAPSPLATLKQDFSTSNIEITYSRPSVKGRKIFGDLIPYNTPWRTGANAPTKISFGEDLEISGTKLKAGTYVLYTIPGEKEWKVIINTGKSNWSAEGFDKNDDVAVFNTKVTKTNELKQTFTIDINNISSTNCDIELSWENSKIIIPVTADNDQRITEYLENSINNPKLPYQQAAGYYLEKGKNLDKAIIYVDKAIEQNPNAFWLFWLKARILAKSGNKEEAVQAALKSADLASGTPYANEYRSNYEKLKSNL